MDRFQNLDDIQLAILLSLVAKRHCLITSDEQHLDSLQGQLEKVASGGFGLSTAIVTCGPETTLDEFAGAILIQDEHKSPQRSSHSPVMSFDSRESYFNRRHRHQLSGGTVDDFLRGKRIANFVIARNLDLAPEQVQIQSLELIRSGRMIKKEVHHVPARFLFVGLIAKPPSGKPLNCHLVDHFFISHFHELEDIPEDDDTNSESASSVIVRKPGSRLSSFVGGPAQKLLFSYQELEDLSALADKAHVSTEIRRYMMDIVVFLRMHRAVAGGISAKATKDFEYLVKCLCPLNGLEFANPSIVALAAYKIYGHRIVVADEDTDRSVMWGSKKEAVGIYLAQVDSDMIINDVLEEIRAPL